MENSGNFKFKKTVKCTFIGDDKDTTDKLIKNLLEKAGKDCTPRDGDGVSFHGLRFRDALLCIWHVPSGECYQALAENYMKQGMCDVVVCAASQPDILPSSLNVPIIMLQVNDGVCFNIQSVSNGTTTCSVGLDNLDPFIQLLLNGGGVARSYQSGGLQASSGEHDFSDSDALIEIPLHDDDDDSTAPMSTKDEMMEVLQHCQACMFL